MHLFRNSYYVSVCVLELMLADVAILLCMLIFRLAITCAAVLLFRIEPELICLLVGFEFVFVHVYACFHPYLHGLYKHI